VATSSSVREDSSLLSRLDRCLVPLERTMALLTGLAIFSLMFLAVFSVVGRKFLSTPMLGYVDYIEALMPLIAIFGIAYVQREGGHIRMDLFVGRLHGRTLWFVEFLGVLLTLTVLILLTWGAWAHFDRSFDCARPLCSRDSTADVGIPLWPSKLVVPLAFGVLCLRLILQAFSYGRAFWINARRPAAVPLPLTISEQAQAEAGQLEGAN